MRANPPLHPKHSLSLTPGIDSSSTDLEIALAVLRHNALAAPRSSDRIAAAKALLNERLKTVDGLAEWCCIHDIGPRDFVEELKKQWAQQHPDPDADVEISEEIWQGMVLLDE